MTREEAKELLTHVLMTYEPRDQYGDLDDPKPYEEAMTMAIEALKVHDICAEMLESAQPVSIDGDLISRQDAIDALGEEPDIWNDTEEEWAYRNAWVEHISAIKALPSAEQKTGEWKTDTVYAGIRFYRCDQCDFRQSEKSKYCPSCGAKMKGGDTE